MSQKKRKRAFDVEKKGVPRMAVVGQCRTCRATVRWGSGCFGPNLEASSPDRPAADALEAAGQLKPGDVLPRMRRRVQRASRPAADLHQLGTHCGDCGAGHGQFHHWGCDLEKCLRCSGQLYSCHCGRIP